MPLLRAVVEAHNVMNLRANIVDQACLELDVLSRRGEWYATVGAQWDLATAAHVLNEGTYSWLPKSIRDAAEVHATRRECTSSAHVVRRLSDLIRLQLLSTPLPAAINSVRIERGIAYLGVDAEFEVGLTLRMASESELAWTVVSWRAHLPWHVSRSIGSRQTQLLSMQQSRDFISLLNARYVTQVDTLVGLSSAYSLGASPEISLIFFLCNVFIFVILCLISPARSSQTAQNVAIS